MTTITVKDPTAPSWPFRLAVLGSVLVTAGSGIVAWHVAGPYGSRIVHESQKGYRYRDAASGHQVVAFNTGGSGRPNVWSFLDGERVVRMEIDVDDDGAVDRWEYYDGTGSLEGVFERGPSGERKRVEP